MKVIKIYEYPNCGTCKKALKFLTNNSFALEKIDITTHPPSRKELEQMLTHYGGNFRLLFNTAGRVYQENNIKEKVKTMTAKQAIDLLLTNGRLIKRPFVLLENGGIVGFDEVKWKKLFLGE